MKTKIKKITVNASKSYDILIGHGLIDQIGEIFKERFSVKKIAVITDDKVDGLYGEKVINSLKQNGFNTCKFVFPNGEKSKDIATYSKILTFLAQSQITRTDLIVALGGGVVGDITGFSASTFNRGVPFVQVPTTLLSQIDSSVGGKTAIDLPEGKNLVGAFYQPSLVLCDIDTLDTLSKEDYACGMGEGAKYAILDKKIYELINNKFDLLEFVYLCIDYKRTIVEQDEFERGNRKLLNLGHTMAHGIEKLSGYTISHGNAVSMGLKIILEASKKHGFIDQETFDSCMKTIKLCVGEGLDLSCPFEINDLIKVSLHDKKRDGDFINVVMVKGVENCTIEKLEISKLAEYFL
ncbi:MAG: 3-dehydroquinate synthase [Clostridia bacterium]|nr:3-dehydroquinate synthase [Clostridia bacterium]